MAHRNLLTPGFGPRRLVYMDIATNCRITGPTSKIDTGRTATGTVVAIKLRGLNPGITVQWDGESRTHTYQVDAYPAIAWTVIG